MRAALSPQFAGLFEGRLSQGLKGLAMTDEQREALASAVDRVSCEGHGTRLLGALIEAGGSPDLNQIGGATFQDYCEARIDGALAFLAAVNLADLLHQAIQNIRYLRRRR